MRSSEAPPHPPESSVVHGVVSRGGRLQLSRLQPTQAGTYTCVAENAQAEARKDFVVAVLGRSVSRPLLEFHPVAAPRATSPHSCRRGSPDPELGRPAGAQRAAGPGGAVRLRSPGAAAARRGLAEGRRPAAAGRGSPPAVRPAVPAPGNQLPPAAVPALHSASLAGSSWTAAPWCSRA